MIVQQAVSCVPLWWRERRYRVHSGQSLFSGELGLIDRLLLTLMSVLLSVLLSGCATYGSGIQQALDAVDTGDYSKAASSISSSLSETGKDRLLYYMEMGVVEHLQGNYDASNQLLERAASISDGLQSRNLSDTLIATMSNPRQAAYAGADHERVMIYYYKSLNYLAMATQLPRGQERTDAIEGARVETRRLLLRLRALRNDEGSYKEAEDQSTSAKLLNIFSVLMGNLTDDEALTYRDDALAHYLTGITFEMNGEYDDARISYQNAAESYEGGYAEQFRLGPGMASQAWFDVVRMMRLTGGYASEWPKIADEKLDKEQRSQLDTIDGKAQVLVFEHKGRVPEKKELNLTMSVNPGVRSLQLEPYFFEYSHDELAWFYLLYADKGLTTLVSNYLNATRNNQLDFFTKTVFLGPLYYQAEQIGLTQAIGNSLRVAVPYYSPPQTYGTSLIRAGKQSWSMEGASSPQQMAIQTQMRHAGEEIRAAFARASLKAISANVLGSQDSTGLLSFAGKLAAQLTDAAETRSWLLLPAEVGFRRLFLDPGDYTLTLDSHLQDGQRQSNQAEFSLAAGDIRFWQVRATGQNTPGTHRAATEPEANANTLTMLTKEE